MQNLIKEKDKLVVIIDYHLGNLFSVKQACEAAGINAIVSDDLKDILSAKALILPGVGAFKEAVDNLQKLNLFEAIQERTSNGTPIFGICLGMQLLFSKSEEFGTNNGLNLIPGVIRKFPISIDSRNLQVPHISWNKLYNQKRDFQNTPLKSINNNDYLYFVHSYYALPDDKDCILTLTDYGGVEFCSSIFKKNIFATQFHPEKSSKIGISIYHSWAAFNKLI